MIEPVPIALGLGFAIGAAAAYVGARVLVRRIAQGSEAPRAVVAVAFFGGLIALLPAAFLSIVVGGNFGGSWAEAVWGTAAVPFGLALGIATVLALGTASGAVLAGFVFTLAFRSRRAGA